MYCLCIYFPTNHVGSQFKGEKSNIVKVMCPMLKCSFSWVCVCELKCSVTVLCVCTLYARIMIYDVLAMRAVNLIIGLFLLLASVD